MSQKEYPNNPVDNRIDSEIIWRYYHDELDENQQKVLNDWLDDDPKHVAYFERAGEYFAKGSRYDRKPLDKKAMWKATQNNMKGYKTQRNYANLWKVAASVLLAIGAFAAWKLNDQQKHKELSFEDIQPGSTMAQLIVNGGEEVFSLDHNIDTTLAGANTSLVNSDALLAYVIAQGANAEPAIHTLITPRGGEYTVKLSDGTQVWLNADSKLIYPEVFTGENRRVQLVGEAYFEVAHTEDQPFFVTTINQSVKVYGTKFNVSAYADDEFEHTTLIEGSVGVHFNEEETKLVPDRQWYLDTNKGKPSLLEVDALNYVSWMDHEFYFEDVQLGEIMKVLARWYDFDYTFVDARKQGLRLTAGFQRHSSFEKVIERIGLTNEVRFEIDGEHVVVR